MNELYSLIPQVMGSGAAASVGFNSGNTNPPMIGAEQDAAAINEQALYFVEQIQGMVLDAVLDTLKLATNMAEDSAMHADIFGHQFFRSANLNIFSKSKRAKAPDNYVLDSGDEISIAVWGSSVYNENFEVGDDGYINISDAGRVYLKGVTYGAAKQILTRRISSFINTRSSNLEIVLNYARTITVNVVGDVNQPGSYVVPAINSVYNALNAADGPSKIGSVRKIEVKRGGKTVKSFDLYKFLLEGIVDNDFFLQDGDYIYLPPVENVVEIKGSIRRPWKYEMLPDETLAHLIEVAGGFTARSFTKAIQMERITEDKVELKDINLDGVRGGLDITLRDGDIIFIPQIPADFRNFVEVSGAVRFPGQYELKDGNRISDLIKAAGGLKLDAYLERAYITRVTEDLSTTIQNFNLKDVVLSDGTSENILLQRGDLIDIFSKKEFLEEFKVSIEGAVLKPVRKNYAEGMTLNDLVFYAGGLKKEAANNVIEVSRVATKSTDGEDVLTRVIVKSASVGADLEIDEDSKTFELSPMDQVYVRSNPDFAPQANIQIKGEVAFPGRYPILQKDEKILDLIERAGGLTPYAFLQSARLYRKDATIGMVVIDLEEAYRSPDSRPNYILKPGDVIEIPTVNQLVSVSGAIGHPKLDSLETISSFYVPGKRAKYYVKEFAGGFDKNAKKRSTKVVNPDGSAAYTKNVIGIKRYPAVKEGADISITFKKRKEREESREETVREPLNWNILLPSVIVSATSVISSTLLIVLLNN
ncbi:MAG: hypothetical protein GY751_07760 [Bacteroidetes bacterium]|nr:hypothetical protein [Bacteroidota bacterium]